MENWTFFVEFPPSSLNGRDRGTLLTDLFLSPIPDRNITVAEWLQTNGAEIALALSPSPMDSEARAIEILNVREIPLTIWVTLSEEPDGYWTNVESVPQTIEGSESILDWINKKGLDYWALGFDLEVPIQLARAWFSKDYRTLVRELLKFFRALSNRECANRLFTQYIEGLHSCGIPTEFYVFPPLLRPILGGGLPTLPWWWLIEMDYSSAFPRKLGEWILRNRDLLAIPALGIVSGIEGQTPGVNLGGGLPHHLTPEELARDIRTVNSEEMYLYALNSPEVLVTLESAWKLVSNARRT